MSGGIQHFDGTIEKELADGTVVMSSYVDYDEGEKLTANSDPNQATRDRVVQAPAPTTTKSTKTTK